MTVSFVDCRVDHLPSLQIFFAHVYRPDYVMRTHQDLFRWQFGGTPASKGNDYHMKLALIDGAIAGCLGYVPVDVSLGGQVVRGAWIANWVVDHNLRRLGLGPLLIRQVTQQFDITLVLGLSQDAHNLLPRMGWTSFGELTRWVCVLDAHAAGALTEAGSVEWGAVTAPRDWEWLQGANVGRVNRFSDDATALWDRVWGKSAAGTRRSMEFLNWRYACHPMFAYRLFEAHHEGRLGGIAVYRVEQVRDIPMRVGRIVELISEADVEGSLLSALLDDAQSQGVAVLDFFCSSQRFSVLMARYSFLHGRDKVAAQIPFLFQPIERRTGVPFMAYLANVPDVSKVRDWYVTKGDGDQDRPN